MRKFLCAMACLVILALTVLFAYNAGKQNGANHAILNAEPFILEYVEYPADYFTVYVDFGEHGVHEYTGFVG